MRVAKRGDRDSTAKIEVALAINVPDIVLKVGEVAGQVTVIASPEVVLPVDSGEKSSVITAPQIQNLSILGRDATELLKILPGVVYTGQGTQGEVQKFSAGGIGNSSVAGTWPNASASKSSAAVGVMVSCGPCAVHPLL